MKYRAKKTYPMSGGSGNFIIKGKVYDIKKIGNDCYFKSEFMDNHSMGIEYLDKYFEKVEEGMKFKVGDKVRVRKDLEVGKQYGKDSFTDSMLKYLGKSATVVYVYNKHVLDIDNRYYSWTDEMLEPVQELKLDIKNLIGKAIHCDTEEKANQLLEYLDGHGFKWNGDRKTKMTEANNWKHHSENTCYRIYTDKTITYSYAIYFINNGYDIIEFDDLLKEDRPRICEIIGKEVGEKFNIKDYFSNPCCINENGQIRDSNNLIVQCLMLIDIINNPDLIEDIPKAPIYTDKQLEVFKALKLVGFNYVAREEDNCLHMFVSKPIKDIRSWEVDGVDYVEIPHLDEIFDFIKWEDVEPFDLVKCLESIEKQ